MNESHVIQLRQRRGWTQEKLATESGVGVRTIQRLESGSDASLETLSLVADALNVAVGELFVSIDSTALSEQVESLETRTEAQQLTRDRTTAAWRWLFIGVGVAVSFLAFVVGGPWGGTLFVIYWLGGSLILLALRRIVIEPSLDQKLPLSRSRREKRKHRPQVDS
jgi:transcriptional regulator with XRE-family HTH domain